MRHESERGLRCLSLRTHWNRSIGKYLVPESRSVETRAERAPARNDKGWRGPCSVENVKCIAVAQQVQPVPDRPGQPPVWIRSVALKSLFSVHIAALYLFPLWCGVWSYSGVCLCFSVLVGWLWSHGGPL